MSNPNFENLLAVLRRQRPDRPTLFEFFLNESFCERLIGEPVADRGALGFVACTPERALAFTNAGYDYLTVAGSELMFYDIPEQDHQTISLNACHLISDRDSFDNYPWPDPDGCDYSRLAGAVDFLPKGMKLIVCGPGGVLENAIQMVGYEVLCMMLIDDPDLAAEIFSAIGRRLMRYYELCVQFPTVGALIVNDDWGFKTQTMLSPEDMRRYVFPWHRNIVEIIHSSDKPAILHSCGKLTEVMDDIIEVMGYDAKHSYEDTIEPVEQAYEHWGHRIAILGGIDMDFICRSAPSEVTARCRAILSQTDARGGYGLGTGNSVPEYIPYDNYIAMIETATSTR